MLATISFLSWLVSIQRSYAHFHDTLLVGTRTPGNSTPCSLCDDVVFKIVALLPCVFTSVLATSKIHLLSSRGKYRLTSFYGLGRTMCTPLFFLGATIYGLNMVFPIKKIHFLPPTRGVCMTSFTWVYQGLLFVTSKTLRKPSPPKHCSDLYGLHFLPSFTHISSPVTIKPNSRPFLDGPQNWVTNSTAYQRGTLDSCTA